MNKVILKRLVNEMRSLKKDPDQYFRATFNKTNFHEIFFIIKGHPDSDFIGGTFFGKLVLPQDYPMAPPDFIFLTPNGRFSENRKICLTISGFHKEQWSSTWTIKNMILALISIMLDDKVNGVSHIHLGKGERKKMADESMNYNLSHHLDLVELFKDFISTPIVQDDPPNPNPNIPNIPNIPNPATPNP